MIARAYIHIAGPKGGGKTTLAEAMLRAFDAPITAVRCERDDRLDEAKARAARLRSSSRISCGRRGEKGV